MNNTFHFRIKKAIEQVLEGEERAKRIRDLKLCESCFGVFITLFCAFLCFVNPELNSRIYQTWPTVNYGVL